MIAVQALRDWADLIDADGCPDEARLVRAAADEIERLRATNRSFGEMDAMMETTTNTVGNATAFPVPVAGADSPPGMTYRQWLIGTVAAGLLAAPYGPWNPQTDEEFASRCCDIVDALLARMSDGG